MRRWNTQSFIEAARSVHGSRYAYARTEYVRAADPVTITCRKHGDFETLPVVHLKGHHCPDCAKPSRRYTQEEFLTKCRERHGDVYDYSHAVYKGNRVKVTIICRKHGAFEQAPEKHVSGRGCYACNKLKASNKLSFGTEGFIKRARAAHGRRYDYSKTEYRRANQKVEIVCREHGSFWQEANSHTRGVGCPHCAFVQRQQTGFQTKVGDFYGRTVRYQGYELAAARWIVEHKNVEPERVKFSLEDDVPVLFYTVGGRRTAYYPDMMVGNRIVEVKSKYTAEQDRNLIRKQRAAKRAGFRFSLLISDGASRVKTLRL